MFQAIPFGHSMVLSLGLCQVGVEDACPREVAFYPLVGVFDLFLVAPKVDLVEGLLKDSFFNGEEVLIYLRQVVVPLT